MNKPTITPELNQATAAYLAARAKVETLEPVITGLQRSILEAHLWGPADEWKVEGVDLPASITDPNLTYLMDDTDFGLYSVKLHQAYVTHGYQVSFGYCPLLIAKHEQSRAARKFVDAAEYFTGISYDTLVCKFDLYDKFIDTLTALVLSTN